MTCRPLLPMPGLADWAQCVLQAINWQDRSFSRLLCQEPITESNSMLAYLRMARLAREAPAPAPGRKVVV